MKTVLLIALLGADALKAGAQNYAIDWFELAGDVYSFNDTIGRHDAGGQLTNKLYSLAGGFRALPPDVQTAGAPVLAIVPFGAGQARLPWTSNTPGFVLQENANLANTNSGNCPSGASNQVTVPATLPVKSCRLFKP